jgi:hypothetical protein
VRGDIEPANTCKQTAMRKCQFIPFPLPCLNYLHRAPYKYKILHSEDYFLSPDIYQFYKNPRTGRNNKHNLTSDIQSFASIFPLAW